MKPTPDEDRCLGELESEKARKLPAGSNRESRQKKARDHEFSAHAKNWRDSNLHAPD